MDNKENRSKKDKHDDNEEYRKEKRSRRARTRSRSRSRDRESKKDYDRDSRRKRRHSRSPDASYKRRNETSKVDEKKPPPEKKARDTDMLNTRTGGAYIPPARLRMMQSQITDKSSMAYQRLAWEALKKSIHGHINKINVGNIGIIIKELLKENIVRGRGLLCRSVIQAQAASPTFTNVYAALVAAVNSRFPNIGELLLKRLVIQFKRGFKRNDKAICISSASFIAHLVNQRVAHEILALELLTLLVETPTDDSVEVAIAFLKECGQKLTEVSSKGVNAIFEMLRNILHEGQLDKRVQYMIEVMFQVWKDGFKDHPALIEELELVPEEEQFTHLLMLDDATDPQDILNVFKLDEKYEENEQKYKTLSKDILGSDAESGDEDGSGESGDESEEDEEEEKKEMTIIDNTETNLVALRRTIYLTINSSLDFEECAHKLMKMQLKPGQEVELCHMFLDCCAEQRTYEKFYGLLAQRFCNINRMYIGPFEEIFKDSYSTAHRLDTNRLRNVSKFFAHLLFTDSISWEVMECVRLNEEDTTSSSRIYIKILFQELAEYMGLKKLNERLKDPTLQEAFSGLFPRDNPKNTRFSINFFTSIGLGGLTDELREHLKQMPKNVPAAITNIKVDSSSSSSSSSSDSSSSDSSSSDSSDEDTTKKNAEKKKSKGNKRQSPQPNEGEPKEKDKEAPERWGHDGFYDTYGQDARRMNSRPERSDRDTFARPNGGSRRNESRDDIRNGDTDGSDRRRNNRREDDRQDNYRRNRDENYERSRDREEGRRERDHESDRRRNHKETEYRNGDRDSRSDRRYDNKETNRNDREDKNSKRPSKDEEHRRYRESESDKKIQRDEENDRSKRRQRDEIEGDKDNRKERDGENTDKDKRRQRDKNDVDEGKRREKDREDAERYKRKQRDEEETGRDKGKQRYEEEIDRDRTRQKRDENNDKVSRRDREDQNTDKRSERNKEESNRNNRKQRDNEYTDRENKKQRDDDDIDTNKVSKKVSQNEKVHDKSCRINEENIRSNKVEKKEESKCSKETNDKSCDRLSKSIKSKVNTVSKEEADKKKTNEENKNKSKNEKEKDIRNEKKAKSKRRDASISSTSSSSSSSSSSDSSSSSSEEESRKTNRNKKKNKQGGKHKVETGTKKGKDRKKIKDSSSSDTSSESEDEKQNDKNKLGGRYWNTFDIENNAPVTSK